ncbi:hypothetical protein C8R44DRAFT_744949 [Mycena epipterygia]|nr:hypothetical protein C8R44DRAFT_744949 [Mycena epipterygia]
MEMLLKGHFHWLWTFGHISCGFTINTQSFVDFGGIARRKGRAVGDGRPIEAPLDGPLPTTIQSHNSYGISKPQAFSRVRLSELEESMMPCGKVRAFNRRKLKFQCQKPRRGPIFRLCSSQPFPPSANFGNIVQHFHQWKGSCALTQNAPLEVRDISCDLRIHHVTRRQIASTTGRVLAREGAVPYHRQLLAS